ncbi:MAG: GNAT family N-acetyltransferase [Roseburia sp.]|nr:GNAT family N-acetyltransferase [Roseburia sp.]
MNNIVVRKIDTAHAADARLANEPFTLWGRMIPKLENGKWSYEVEKWEQTSELCFPDENYDVEHDDAVFLGAYDRDTCVGVAVLRKKMFRYLYLDDLKVNSACRGKGVGGKLIEGCMDVAKEMGLLGVYTIGQDDNLSACLFYLAHGFEIGGFDNRTYRGTSQEDKANVYFYRDLER